MSIETLSKVPHLTFGKKGELTNMQQVLNSMIKEEDNLVPEVKKKKPLS